MLVHFPGSADHLQLFQISLEPDEVVEPHGHHEDEIVYVVEGELRFAGDRICGVGSAVFVPGLTVYGFQAGPAGARFLNFRARHDSGMLSPVNVSELRRAARGN